jgi:hypothetical protein
MTNAVKIVIAELGVAAVGVFLISASYLFVIPTYFNDQSTYSALAVGVVLVAVASAYIAHRVSPTSGPLRWIAVASTSVAVAVVTLLISMFFIINARGS